ncbi:MAG TPA: RNA polymerase sigma factor region1.1 domain-containing protein, partial [Bdellovibrionales bacterium]|nr:RNA polymerase sigma factor region1.1 domain-containing protein [Bdellovibrionales bacterium]
MSKNKPADDKKEGRKELTLKEQEALINEEIQKFIALAKTKGELSIEEINENLPAEITAPEVLDSLMQALDVNGVKISDAAGNKDTEAGEGGEFLADPAAAEEEDEEEEATEEDLKGNDPVRLYLRKMGSVS